MGRLVSLERDVLTAQTTSNFMKRINWSHIKEKLRTAILVLPNFFRNPVQGMRTLPDWEWLEILILQAIFAAGCSILSNLLERDFFGMITGIIVAPITFLIMSGIATGIFYYVFKFYFDREVPYRQIYIHVLFASIPILIVSTVAFLIPPILLLGAAATVLLLFVGFVSNFHIPEKPLRNLLLGILSVYLLFWAFTLIGNTSKHKTLRQKATPESLDILEKELNLDQ